MARSEAEAAGSEPSERSGGGRDRWVVVLAGGAGRRLSTLAADAYGRTVPKQFCALRGDRSLLQMTLARARRSAPPERQLVVVDRSHERWWWRELAALPPENIVVQPGDRGTATGLLLPLARIRRRDPQAEVVVLPSDHFFAREDLVVEGLEEASTEISRRPGRLVLLGVEASRPSSQLGWIEYEPGTAEDRACPVVSFHEKPPASIALRLFERGALINSLILVAHLEDLLTYFERHSELPERLRGLLGGEEPTPDELVALFAGLERLDLSRDLLQRATAELLVLPLRGCGWADLGTVQSVQECLIRQRPPLLASLTGCRAPVDLSAPRQPRNLCPGISREELARFVEML